MRAEPLGGVTCAPLGIRGRCLPKPSSCVRGGWLWTGGMGRCSPKAGPGLLTELVVPSAVGPVHTVFQAHIT